MLVFEKRRQRERARFNARLEILGWGVFLGIALLLLVPVFRRGGLETAIRWTAAAFGVLSLTGAVGYAWESRIFLAGFLAWGFTLYLWTGMLVVCFRRIFSGSEGYVCRLPE